MTQKKKKRGILDGYKTYDTSKGFGSPDQWRDAFNVRMGLNKAKEVVGQKSPWAILGISEGATLAEIQKAYKKKALEVHPDRNFEEDAEERFKEVLAAYEILLEKFS